MRFGSWGRTRGKAIGRSDRCRAVPDVRLGPEFGAWILRRGIAVPSQTRNCDLTVKASSFDEALPAQTSTVFATDVNQCVVRRKRRSCSGSSVVVSNAMAIRNALFACALVILPHAVAHAREVDSGPPALSPGVAEAYERFKRLPGRLYFAISEDGRSAGWSYCKEFGPCKRSGARSRAVYFCERYSKGVPCRIYADMNGIVWKGKVSVDEPVSDPLSKTAPPSPPEGPSRPIRLIKCRLPDGFVISMVPERCKSVGGTPE